MVNGLLLFGVGGYVLLEATMRLANPSQVSGLKWGQTPPPARQPCWLACGELIAGILRTCQAAAVGSVSLDPPFFDAGSWGQNAEMPL